MCLLYRGRGGTATKLASTRLHIRITTDRSWPRIAKRTTKTFNTISSPNSPYTPICTSAFLTSFSPSCLTGNPTLSKFVSPICSPLALLTRPSSQSWWPRSILLGFWTDHSAKTCTRQYYEPVQQPEYDSYRSNLRFLSQDANAIIIEVLNEPGVVDFKTVGRLALPCQSAFLPFPRLGTLPHRTCQWRESKCTEFEYSSFFELRTFVGFGDLRAILVITFPL